MKNNLKEIFANSITRRMVFFFSVIIIFLSIWLLFQKNKMEEQLQLKIQFIEQKNMLRDELDDIIDEHDDLLDEYGELNTQLYKKDSIIQNQIAEIRNLIRTKSETKNDLKEARKKIETLKTISKRYIANIDSLLILNEKLTIQKDSVINVNKNINWKNYKLSKQNEKLAETVNKGSILKINNVEVQAIKYKSTGKEVFTKYAKKTQKLRICFNILANPIAESELKKAYIQVVNNNGFVLQGKNEIFTFLAEEQITCTMETEFDYKNIEASHCVEWERLDILESGYYLINIIIEGRQSSSTTFKLK